MNRIGADIFVESLIREGVEYIFGIPGAVIIPLFDKLYDSPIKIILTRHEQGAGHAADGYARARNIAGDASIQMNIQELATAVQYNLPVKVAILNNGCLGMVRQWQELFYQKRYAGTLFQHNPDFVAVARGYGAEGIRVTKKDEVRPAIEQAINTPKPVFMDFVIDREEKVFPMVPAGNATNKMIGGMA